MRITGLQPAPFSRLGTGTKLVSPQKRGGIPPVCCSLGPMKASDRCRSGVCDLASRRSSVELHPRDGSFKAPPYPERRCRKSEIHWWLPTTWCWSGDSNSDDRRFERRMSAVCIRPAKMVRVRGLEPPTGLAHERLRLACMRSSTPAKSTGGRS